MHQNFGIPTWDMYDYCRRLQTILHITTSSCTRTVLSLAVSLRPVILHYLMNWGYVYASKDCHHHHWTVYILYTMSLSTSDLCQLWTINTDCVKEPNLRSKPNLYVLLNIPLLCMVLCFQPRDAQDVGHHSMYCHCV